jgi:hypothetical protein
MWNTFISCSQRSNAPISYFTPERPAPNGISLCELVAEGEEHFTHRYLRTGPKPVERVFAQAVSQYLDFEG